MSVQPTLPTRHGWTQTELEERAPCSNLEGLQRAGLSLSTLDTASGPGNQSKTTSVSFSISPHPSEGTRDMMGCAGQEEEGTTESLPSPLPCRGGTQGPGGLARPTGHGDPTAGSGGGRRASGSQHRHNQPGLPVHRAHQETQSLGQELAPAVFNLL